MPVSELGDPRLQALFGLDNERDEGVRPKVRLPGRGVPTIVVVIVLSVFAILLFVLLNGRRNAPVEPSVRSRAADNDVTSWAAPPPLYIPPVPAPLPADALEREEEPKAVLAARSEPIGAMVPSPQQAAPLPGPVPQIMPSPPPATAPRASSGAALIMDGGGGGVPGPATADAASSIGAAGTVSRMRASALANRSMTVPQGYLIPAVIETGFNSTGPGFARAIVSRDVRGFDGRNVLIPRGSRLVGEYHADVAPSQKRAIILWTRLIRPDGMTIPMDSPAVDPVGRGGVAASVNTHFWQRFGDALLQSTVELGRTFAGRAVTGSVVVLPGTTTAAALPATSGTSAGSSYSPTLTVPPGRSISVFVAHDLDFSAAGPGR